MSDTPNLRERLTGEYARAVRLGDACNVSREDMAEVLEELARLKEQEEALDRIEALQPKALAYIEANGFVFDDIGAEPGNWKHLAFSLYTELCEANSICRALSADTEEEEPR